MGATSSKQISDKIVAENNIVSELALYLKLYGESALHSNGRLCLTTTTLRVLNELLDQLPSLVQARETGGLRRRMIWRLSCGVITRLDVDTTWDIEFIKNIVESVHCLQITASDTSSSEPGSVNLANFTSLRSLELRNLPIALVRNLRKSRATLEALVIRKGIENAQSVFELCGQDQSFPAEWPNLGYANLRGNHLLNLDDSFRLLTSLTVLDVSRNLLQTTRGLECLPCLQRLNLSYNFLSELPQLTSQQKTQLKVLLVAFNKFDKFNGIEEFKNLEVFDARDNFLILKEGLHDFSYLPRLLQLRLWGNPVSAENSYRFNVLDNLSPKLSGKFQLDGRSLNKAEQLHLHKMPFSSMSSQPADSANSQLRSWGVSRDPPAPSLPPLGASTGPAGLLDSLDSVALTTDDGEAGVPSGGRGRHRRVNQVVLREDEVLIHGAGSDADISSSEPEHQQAKLKAVVETDTVLQGSIQRTRDHIEDLKRRYKDNWLLNFSDSMTQLGIPSPTTEDSRMIQQAKPAALDATADSERVISTIYTENSPQHISTSQKIPQLDDSSDPQAHGKPSTPPSTHLQPEEPSIRFLSCLNCTAGFLESRAERRLISESQTSSCFSVREPDGRNTQLLCPLCHSDLIKDQNRTCPVASLRQETPPTPAVETEEVQAVVEEEGAEQQIPPQIFIETSNVDGEIQSRSDISPASDSSPGYTTIVPTISSSPTSAANVFGSTLQCPENGGNQNRAAQFFVGSYPSSSGQSSPAGRPPLHFTAVDPIGEESEVTSVKPADEGSSSSRARLTSSVGSGSSLDSFCIQRGGGSDAGRVGGSSRAQESDGEDQWIRFNDVEDLGRVDANLQLCIDVSMLEKGEDFCFLIKSYVVPPGKNQAIEALIVVTTLRLLLVEWKNHSSQEVNKCIKLVDKSQLDRFLSLNRSVQNQLFNLEFCKPARRYQILTGDEVLTQAFLSQFKGVLCQCHPQVYKKRNDKQQLDQSSHDTTLRLLQVRFVSPLDVSHREQDSDDVTPLTIEAAYLVRKHVTKAKERLNLKGEHWCILLLTPLHVMTIVCKFSSKNEPEYILDRCVELPHISTAARSSSNKLSLAFFENSATDPVEVTFISTATREAFVNSLGTLWTNVFMVTFVCT